VVAPSYFVGRTSSVLNDSVVMLPYIYGYDPDDSLNRVKNDNISDPLIFGGRVLSALASKKVAGNSKSLKIVKDRFLSFMRTRDDTLGYWPHQAYEDFPAGWYSGMDFSGIALAAQALYESTRDEEYKRIAITLMEQLIRPVDAGGAMHSTEISSCWIGEFVWPGMTREHETYVLNGFLYSLQTLAIFSKIYPDNANFVNALKCAEDGYKSSADRFVFSDQSWLYYMLHNKTTNQPHYVIFETMQFDALHRLTNSEFYAREADIRRNIFGRSYKVFKKDGKFLFSLLGDPHPTRPDIYHTILMFRDAAGKLTGTADRVDFKGSYFMRGDLPPNTESVSIIQKSRSQVFTMYTGPLVTPADDSPEAAAFTEETFALIEKSDEGWLATGESRLILNLDRAVPAERFRLFALDLRITRGANWGIGLWDPDGNEVFRYLPPPNLSERSLVPISSLGFTRPETIGKRIKSVVLYFYPKEPASIRINGLHFFPDYYAFSEWAKDVGESSILIDDKDR